MPSSILKKSIKIGTVEVLHAKKYALYGDILIFLSYSFKVLRIYNIWFENLFLQEDFENSIG
jgi:hypothetical protein